MQNYSQQPYYQQQWMPPPPPVKKKPNTTLGCIILIALVLFCSFVYMATGSHTTTAVQGVMPTITSVATSQLVTPVTPTATHKPKTPTPTATPKPTPVAQVPTRVPTSAPTAKKTGIYGNPWGYDFNSGNLITNPPSNFCDYFPCIATFVSADDPDGGYVVQCADGNFSQSGGESGSCSHHGGEGQPLYSH